jgi:glycosyltransferase involved in cell wall biosynthesis
MTKKKLGMIIYANPDYYPPTVNAVHLLSEHFDIILIGRNHETPHWQYPSNVSVHRLGKYSSRIEREQKSAKEKLLEYTNFVIQSRCLLKDVSLIYAYDTFAYIASYLSAIHIFKKTPLIYHSHEISDKLSSLSSLSGFLQRIERKLIHQATIIVFPDKDRAIVFQSITNIKQQPLLVPNFPRRSFFKMCLNWRNQISNRFAKPQVILQGGISQANSMTELINSLILGPECICIKFIGSINAPDLELMKYTMHQKGIGDRVSYFNPVPYNELQSHTWKASIGVCLYKKLELNCHTNVTATNKIYEYAACALPAIVSDFSNYREFLGNESWVRFANPDDPQSIANAIKDILSDFENYQKMCLAARKAFEEKFNYETVFTPLLNEIISLVE